MSSSLRSHYIVTLYDGRVVGVERLVKEWVRVRVGESVRGAVRLKYALETAVLNWVTWHDIGQWWIIIYIMFYGRIVRVYFTRCSVVFLVRLQYYSSSFMINYQLLLLLLIYMYQNVMLLINVRVIGSGGWIDAGYMKSILKSHCCFDFEKLRRIKIVFS